MLKIFRAVVVGNSTRMLFIVKHSGKNSMNMPFYRPKNLV